MWSKPSQKTPNVTGGKANRSPGLSEHVLAGDEGAAQARQLLLDLLADTDAAVDVDAGSRVAGVEVLVDVLVAAHRAIAQMGCRG